MSTLAKVVAIATLFKLLTIMNADISRIPTYHRYHFYGFDDGRKYNGA
jgi:hypothetical protein